MRVPLSGRRVRGFVLEVVPDRAGNLKDIAAISGSSPVFDRKLARSLEWAATHYVAPFAVLLERCAPPNLPKSQGRPPATDLIAGDRSGLGLGEAVTRVLDGRRGPVTAQVGTWQSLSWVEAVIPLLMAGKSTLVVAATAAEVGGIAERLGERFGDRLVTVAGENAKALTAAWEAAQQPGRLVVGTPRASVWQIGELALSVVLEEGRRAMKDRQTPTVHVRDLLATRARIEGFALAFLGPTPTLEVLSRGAQVVQAKSRPWGLVEVVDRAQDPPGSGFLSAQVIAALRATASTARHSFIFTHRRAADSSMRCTQCRRVRRCSECGSRLGRAESCRRCGTATGPCVHCGSTSFEEMGSIPERIVAEVNRKLGPDHAGLHPANEPISVGTERDLAGLEQTDLAVAVDADALALGENYRTSEEALRVLARLGDALKPGTGRRMMVQTSMPNSPLFDALKRGKPIPYLEDLLVERARLGMPPSTEMLALEVRGEVVPPEVDEQVKTLESAAILGPADIEGGRRWLIQGDLSKVRSSLPRMIQGWRDSGLTVRIDADPIDL